MFDIGLPELLVIIVIALVIFGPDKLPELTKALGRAIREFQKATEEVKESFEKETNDFMKLKNNLPDLLEKIGAPTEPTTGTSKIAKDSFPSEPTAEASLSVDSHFPVNNEAQKKSPTSIEAYKTKKEKEENRS